MEGKVEISLEDYEKLRDVEKEFNKQSSALQSEREGLKRSLDFSRVTLTVWTLFILEKMNKEDDLPKLVEAFNNKGSVAKLELRSDEGRPYLIAKEKTNEYL